jgi:hypothetical protein
MKKPAKVIDLAAKRYARQVLDAFDKLDRKDQQKRTEKRADVERKARKTL